MVVACGASKGEGGLPNGSGISVKFYVIISEDMTGLGSGARGSNEEAAWKS